jgi:hypothetical protein
MLLKGSRDLVETVNTRRETLEDEGAGVLLRDTQAQPEQGVTPSYEKEALRGRLLPRNPNTTVC